MDPSTPEDHQPQSTPPRRAHIAFPDHDRPPDKKKSTTTITSYTSLRDVLPGGGGGRHHLNGDLPSPIRNHLVKHAACAYLHPRASPPSLWSFFDDDDDDDEGGHVGPCSLCTRSASSALTLLGSLLAVTRRKVTGYNDRRRS